VYEYFEKRRLSWICLKTEFFSKVKGKNFKEREDLFVIPDRNEPSADRGYSYINADWLVFAGEVE